MGSGVSAGKRAFKEGISVGACISWEGERSEHTEARRGLR